MKAQFQSKKSFGEAKGGESKAPRTEELVDVVKFRPNKWVRMRPVGPLVAKGIHWVPVTLKETPGEDGKPQRVKSFPQVCLAFNPDTEEVDSSKHCPWCAAQTDKIRLSVSYYQNVILRSAQEDEPRKKPEPTRKEVKTGFKEKDSNTWTPAAVLPVNTNLAKDLKRIQLLNRHKDKKTGETKAMPLSHERYGRDILVMHNPDEKNASKRWSSQLEEKSPLTEEETEILLWDIEALDQPLPEDKAEREFKSWWGRVGKTKKRDAEDGDDDDMPEEDERPKKKRRPVEDDDDEPVKKKRRPSEDDDDLPEDDEDEAPKKKRKPKDEDDDFDEDDEPVKKKRKPSKDDDDDLPEDDDDEDEPPKKKRRPSEDDDDDVPVKKKKKPSEDDDDFGDEDDEKPKKKKKPAADDFDDDGLDEDEPPKRKKKPARDEEDDDEPPKKKRKPSKDEDDDDDLPEDDEDD